ncbi:hypothetical protein NFI96_010345, partial [Prochilodus magdalenae]
MCLWEFLTILPEAQETHSTVSTPPLEPRTEPSPTPTSGSPTTFPLCWSLHTTCPCSKDPSLPEALNKLFARFDPDTPPSISDVVRSVGDSVQLDIQGERGAQSGDAQRQYTGPVVGFCLLLAAAAAIISVYMYRRRSPGVSEEQLYSSVPGVSGNPPPEGPGYAAVEFKILQKYPSDPSVNLAERKSSVVTPGVLGLFKGQSKSAPPDMT